MVSDAGLCYGKIWLLVVLTTLLPAKNHFFEAFDRPQPVGITCLGDFLTSLPLFILIYMINKNNKYLYIVYKRGWYLVKVELRCYHFYFCGKNWEKVVKTKIAGKGGYLC